MRKLTNKIDKFYLIFFVVMLLLAIVVIFSLRGIFSSINKAAEIKESETLLNEGKINRINLEKAFNFINNPKKVPLDLKE